MQHGWPYVLELIQHLLRKTNWKLGELAREAAWRERVRDQPDREGQLYISERCKTNFGKITDTHLSTGRAPSTAWGKEGWRTLRVSSSQLVGSANGPRTEVRLQGLPPRGRDC